MYADLINKKPQQTQQQISVPQGAPNGNTMPYGDFGSLLAGSSPEVLPSIRQRSMLLGGSQYSDNIPSGLGGAGYLYRDAINMQAPYNLDDYYLY